MEPKFKIGDVVRINTEVSYNNRVVPQNSIGKITHRSKSTRLKDNKIEYSYLLNEFTDIFFIEHELEKAWEVVQAGIHPDCFKRKIKPMKPILLPKFKVGDKVRTTEDIQTFNPLRIIEKGEVGLITSFNKSSVCNFIYSIDSIPKIYLLSEMCLELVNDLPNEEKEEEKDFDKRVSKARDHLLREIFE